MKIKKILSSVLALIMALSLCACADSDTQDVTGTNEVTEAVDEVLTEDESVSSLALVSTAADITEILDGLGYSANIIIADTYSLGIGDVDDEVCTLDYTNPDVETIISLEPDLVLVSGSSTDGTANPYSVLSDAGVNVIYIPTAESIQGIKDNITTIANNIGAPDAANALIESIDSAVEDAYAAAESYGSELSVYFEISAAPWLYSFGSQTYLDEIISICGGRNIYADQAGWISNTEESVIAADPDVIITNVMYDGYDFNEIYSRAGWDVLKAVKNSCVYSVDANASSRGSQNIVIAIEQISNAISDAQSKYNG